MTEDRWRRLEAEVLIARGEGKAAAEMYQSFDVTTDAIPDPFEIHIWTSICELLDDLPAAATAAAAYLSALRDSDSPVCHTSGALAGHRVLALAGDSLPPEVAGGLRDLAADSLNRATAADPGSVRRSFYGIWLALAEAFAARLEGASAVEHLRRAVGATATCGAYVGLEPRLLLAEELLAHADRDEGRELLTSVWSDARGMEARGHEQRAVVLATKARVPLSQEVAASGPLARLTPREREVLDLLAEGATNRDISGALFISEKTASVHVSNLLAKLGVPNRGAAAALAHRLGLS
jgi:DNA-binding CsgD family transcriptional regulator